MYHVYRHWNLSRAFALPRPVELRDSLLKGLEPAVAQLQRAYDKAQQVSGEGQEEAFEDQLAIMKRMVAGYDSATVHVKVHAKPKSQPKAKGKGKAKKP